MYKAYYIKLTLLLDTKVGRIETMRQCGNVRKSLAVGWGDLTLNISMPITGLL